MEKKRRNVYIYIFCLHKRKQVCKLHLTAVMIKKRIDVLHSEHYIYPSISMSICIRSPGGHRISLTSTCHPSTEVKMDFSLVLFTSRRVYFEIIGVGGLRMRVFPANFNRSRRLYWRGAGLSHLYKGYSVAGGADGSMEKV